MTMQRYLNVHQPIEPDDILAIEREYCGRGLVNFTKRAWQQIDPGTPYVHGWHMDALAAHLEASVSGQINRLLINIPPGTAKSTLVGVMFPAWVWTFWPEARFIAAAHERTLAIRDNRKSRLLVQSPWYQSLWNVPLVKDQNEKAYYENARRGFRQCGAFAALTGKRGDFIIIDDPQSPEKAYSDADRQSALRVFEETLPTRLNDPSKSVIIVIMQRLHERDISGHALANDLGYEHLCLPMEFAPARRCVTSIGWQDPRTREGELLFPARFPREVVERDKKAMGDFAVAGQFQQSPVARGGNLIQQKWLHRYRATPPLTYRLITGDTAAKTKTANDYSVFMLWGQGADGRAYLLDMLRGKFEIPELEAALVAWISKHKNGPTLRSIHIEDAASGVALNQLLRRKGGLPITPIKRGKGQGDKVFRASDILGHLSAGNVLIPEAAPWVHNLTAELTQFPAGAHDDQVDAFVDGVALLLNTSGFNWAAMG